LEQNAKKTRNSPSHIFGYRFKTTRKRGILGAFLHQLFLEAVFEKSLGAAHPAIHQPSGGALDRCL
jgi:hypothetical protein